MMQFIKQNLLAIGGAALVAVALFVYWTYFGSSSAPLLSQTNAASPVSKQLLLTLSNLHTLKLDQSVFTDPTFVSLNDFGVQIPPQSVGRGDPFAPLGSVVPAKK